MTWTIARSGLYAATATTCDAIDTHDELTFCGTAILDTDYTFEVPEAVFERIDDLELGVEVVFATGEFGGVTEY